MALALAAFGMAAVFSGCEVSESNLVSCDMRTKIFTITSHMCAETNKNSDYASSVQSQCKSESNVLGSVNATIGDGCPSGAVKICADAKGTMYYYDSDAANQSCEQLND